MDGLGMKREYIPQFKYRDLKFFLHCCSSEEELVPEEMKDRVTPARFCRIAHLIFDVNGLGFTKKCEMPIYFVPHGAIAEEILFAGSNLQNPKRFAEEKFKQMTRAVVKSSLLEVVILQGLKWFHHQSLYRRRADSTTTKFSSAELITVLSRFSIHHCRIRIKRGQFPEWASIDVEL
ncbi:hypothetical protein CDAR_15751 [Caerostris darwini]|uniref:Uncharacterized protein n=1 Tax=Caerostris darwini TaxID=1538125 RepID=A0AAV4N9C4_9ARAC|nr:hypothetical protein CDAR_15751 [Caerostris darwini]